MSSAPCDAWPPLPAGPAAAGAGAPAPRAPTAGLPGAAGPLAPAGPAPPGPGRAITPGVVSDGSGASEAVPLGVAGPPPVLVSATAGAASPVLAEGPLPAAAPPALGARYSP